MESCSSWGWMGPWEAMWSNTCSKKSASLEQLSGPCSVSIALKVFQERNTTASLGNLFQCLTTVMVRNSFLFLNGFLFTLVSYSYATHLHLLSTLYTGSWSLSSPVAFSSSREQTRFFFSVPAYHEVQLFNHPGCSSLDSNISRFSCGDEPKTGLTTPHTKA